MRWPRRQDPLQALLLAAVAEPAVARPAWAGWSAGRSLDDVSWQELRLLGAVAARAELLGVAPDARPRLEGIRRFVWTRTQLKLAAALPVLRRLHARGVRFCLLKGAALIAGGHRAPGERFLRDVDVLVPRQALAEAVAILFETGWRPEHYASLEEVFSLGFPRCHALAFRSAAHPDDAIDLHLSASELGRFPRSDAALWSRTAEARILGLPVRVPAPEDLLCHALVHSFLSDGQEGRDWVLDAVALARRPRFDWARLVEESRRRGVEALVAARLRRLQAMPAPGIPAEAAAGLEAGEPAAELRRELAIFERRGPWRPAAEQQARRAARAVRARRLLALDAHSAVDERPPFPAACRWLRLDAPLPVGFPETGRPRAVEITGRILHAAAQAPIPYRLYCGSVRLAAGRTRPRRSDELGSVHWIRVKARIDPAVATAEGRPPLSLYFGRRSRATSPLGPEAVFGIDHVC
jgi:hypothetical protein